jgi:hypothetical protein
MRQCLVVDKFPQDIILVSRYNLKEIYERFFGLSVPLIIGVQASVIDEYLLKFVEEYKGELVMYFLSSPGSTLLSRFNEVHIEKHFNSKKEFPMKSEVQRWLFESQEAI